MRSSSFFRTGAVKWAKADTLRSIQAVRSMTTVRGDPANVIPVVSATIGETSDVTLSISSVSEPM
jgi:hypothetical protein